VFPDGRRVVSASWDNTLKVYGLSKSATLFAKGKALKQQKKWSEAIAAFQNCVALDANHSSAWFQLGYAYNNQTGSYKATEASYEPYTRCIALDPKHALAHNNLGNVLKDVRKDYDGAEKMYRKAIELDPNYAAAGWNLSQILEEQRNDIPGAIELVEKYVRLGGRLDGKDRLAKLRAKLK
jgi:tetratricopeptide (TPR) repeat protein